MDTKKILHIVSFTLLIIGGLNWGLIGFLNFDLLDTIFPSSQPDDAMAVIQMVIQTLVGVSAVYVLFTHKGDCKVCGGK